MLNQVVIVGRLVKDPELRNTKDGKIISFITLAVNRGYKNPVTGVCDTDFIACTLWEGTAQATATHCKKGSVIGVKGRLTTRTIEDPSQRVNSLELIAEKVTFISPSCKGLTEELDELVNLDVAEG